MSKELRRIEIAFTVNSYELLPPKDGEQMYADDVVSELRDVIAEAVNTWYGERGKGLLACEPIL